MNNVAAIVTQQERGNNKLYTSTFRERKRERERERERDYFALIN